VNTALTTHTSNTGNPHSVTAVQVGADPAGSAAAVNTALTTHTSNTANPHSVTAAQVGADPAGSAAGVQTNLTTHVGNTGNPHSVTAVQVGADPAGSAAAVNTALTTHTSNTGNPHSVTAVQVGADPAGSAAGVQTNLTTHVGNTANPHSVTAVQVGADPAGSAAGVQTNLATHEGLTGTAVHGLGTAATADATDFMPRVVSATAGRLVTLLEDGTLEDAGYAADVNPTAGSVVRRDNPMFGGIKSAGTSGGSRAFSATVSGGGYGFVSVNDSDQWVSATDANGIIRFLGENANANRLAQTNEVQAVSFGAPQTISPTQQAQARANIGAETSGAAATVQGNLNTHTGLTGTAVHGLGTASTLTAGATGSSLVTAATVTAARTVLEFPSPTSPPIYTLHNGIATKATVVTGSGAVTAGQPEDLQSGTTANSRARLNVGLSTLSVGYGNARWDWSKRLEFFGNLRRLNANAEGMARIFYCKPSGDAFGVVAEGNYVAIELGNGIPTAGIVAKNGVLTTVVFVSPPADTIGQNWFITSNNGTVSWWSNNTLLGTTTSGPTASSVVGQIGYELQNGATPALFRLSFVSASNGYL
jgi:hypothetical protein